MKLIKFEDFIRKAKKNFFKSHKKIFCFIGQEYPILFFCYLFDLLKNQNNLPFPLKNIDLNLKDKSLFYSELKQSFLGQSNFYWLSNFSDKLTAKNKIEILDFLSNYQGPHVISLFLSQDEKVINQINSDTVEFIDIIQDVDFDVFLKILDLFDKKIAFQKLEIVSSQFFANSTHSLDSICMLINYLELINIRDLKEFNEYISLIVGSNPSLYFLSEAFFAKKEKEFLNLWQDLRNDYTDMFWIFYWSDQIWRAYYVVKYLNQKDFINARKMSFRLPANFIKRDYKQFDLNNLVNSYDFLFTIDFSIKKGSSFFSLDLFYLNHFLNS
ncbi:MAG: hypothetical protein ABIA74_03870 [bacterium]